MWTCQLNKATHNLVCICRQKKLLPVSSINSSQTDKALPVKTFKPNFVTVFVYFGNSLMIICEISLFVMLRSVTAANRATPFCSGNLREFGVACLEELEVNQWILKVLDIRREISQSQRAKSTIHCFSIY